MFRRAKKPKLTHLDPSQAGIVQNIHQNRDSIACTKQKVLWTDWILHGFKLLPSVRIRVLI